MSVSPDDPIAGDRLPLAAVPPSAASCAAPATDRTGARGLFRSYPDGMLDLDAIDVEEVATALEDQTDYEH